LRRRTPDSGVAPLSAASGAARLRAAFFVTSPVAGSSSTSESGGRHLPARGRIVQSGCRPSAEKLAHQRQILNWVGMSDPELIERLRQEVEELRRDNAELQPRLAQAMKENEQWRRGHPTLSTCRRNLATLTGPWQDPTFGSTC
jgi:hypothetical protein